MEIYRLRCLHFIGFLLCLFLKPILTTEANEANVEDEYTALFEGQRYEPFEWNLLRALGTPEFGNVVISPLSVKMVLAMLYEGSSGATEKELEHVLNFPPNKQDTKKKFQKIINSLKIGTSGQTLDMGSRVFLDSTVQPQQRFEAALKSFYNTDIKPLDFYNLSASTDEINYWVSNVTHGYIKDLVAEGDLEGATMILANAIYYKGLWRNPFPKENTQDGVFYTAPNKPIQVPYMHINYPFYFGSSTKLDAKILRLPFQSGNIAMFIILPNSKGGLNSLINDLNPEVLRRQIYIMQNEKHVDVYLPRFSFDFNAKLGRILQTLGLNHIFQNTASLAGIARGKGVVKKLMVSNVLQKSGIEVNEEGSTAYAASVVPLANKFGGSEEKFNASHPFVFYIEDEFTGNVLFAGKVENPLQDVQPRFREDLKFPSRFAETNEENTASPSSSSEAPAPVTATSAQSQNFGQGQNFPQTPFQNFNNQGQNLGTTNIQLFNQYEENHLQAHKYFYFDMDLLKEICFKEKEGNILISPLSIKSILAMLLEGANGATAKELQMALHLPSNPSNQRVRYQFERLFTEIKRPTEGVHLQIANGIFIAKKYTVLAEFKNIVNQYYSADVKEVNFTNPVQSTNTINKWVNDNTNGIIPKIVEDGSLGNVPILLANALYFKGTWERAFSELGTKVSCFFLPNNECQMSPMMDVIDNFKFAELKELSAKLVELPYAGRAYSMVIVLPNDRNGIELLSRDITKLSFNEVLETLNETEVFVTLPRFKISYDVDLVNYLPGVHISRIFNSDAELNGVVADVNTRVSNMLHKAYVEVNEQGTVAAAATGAVVIPLMVNTKPRIKADHPFLFFIRHVSTGTILFEGRVSVPERSYGQPNHQQTQQQNIPQRPVQQSTVNRQQPLPSQRPVPQQPVDNIYNQFMGSTQPEYSFQNPQPQQPSSYENTPQQQDVLFQSPLPVNYNPQTQPFPAQNPAEQNYQQQQQQHQQSRQPQTQQRQPQLRPPQQQQQQQQPQHQQPTRRTQPQSPLAQASNIHVQPNRQRQEVVLQADDPNAHRNDLKNEQLPHTNSATEQSPVWSNK